LPRFDWSGFAQLVAAVLLFFQMPEAVFSILNPHLRKGFEVQAAWFLVGAFVILAANLVRKIWIARTDDPHP
jgi:hypothetical protein